MNTFTEQSLLGQAISKDVSERYCIRDALAELSQSITLVEDAAEKLAATIGPVLIPEQAEREGEGINDNSGSCIRLAIKELARRNMALALNINKITSRVDI